MSAFQYLTRHTQRTNSGAASRDECGPDRLDSSTSLGNTLQKVTAGRGVTADVVLTLVSIRPGQEREVDKEDRSLPDRWWF